MKGCAILAVFLTICSAATAHAYSPYYVDGAGLDESDVSEIYTPENKIDITEMDLESTIDLSDSSNIYDSAAIEEAISKIKTGQALYLPEGVYNLDRVIELRSGKSIVGADNGNTVLKLKDGSSGAVIKGDSVVDCVVENMTLTSDWDGQYSLSTTNENPYAGQLKFGVLLYSSERIAVRALTIEKFNTAGVAVNSCKNCSIYGNTILNATDLSEGGHGYGIILQDSSGNMDGSQENIIEENDLLGPYLRHGIILQGFSNHNKITSNDLYGIRLDAVDLHGAGEHHNEIAYNKIYNGGEAGVGVGNGPVGVHGASGEYNYIHNNDISECVYGVTVMMGTKNTVIAENRISLLGKTAIRLRYGNSTVIYGNYIYDTPAAVLFQRESDDEGSSLYTFFDNNTIVNAKTAFLLEENTAETGMFGSLSGNIYETDEFITIMSSNESYTAIAAGYSDRVLMDIGIGNGESTTLPENDYSQISYFQWELQTLVPKDQMKVIYDEAMRSL